MQSFSTQQSSRIDRVRTSFVSNIYESEGDGGGGGGGGWCAGPPITGIPFVNFPNSRLPNQ